MHANTRKERFSLAYVSAVAAHAGFQLVEPKVDYDSIDAEIIADFGRRPHIELQLKATSRDVARGTNLAYPLPIKNYNDLRAEVIVPRILVLVLLPESEEDWLVHSEDELRLRRCGYWMSLDGMPEKPNEQSVTVQVPRTQTFDSGQLRDLMAKAHRGERL